MHSPKFNTVKKWWERWHDIAMIRNAVEKEWITEAEYAEITGEPY